MAVANPNKLVVLITGDISFFYDSNALWNKYLPANFRIILINNDGGGIFNIIEGPQKSKQNNLFVASHSTQAKDICRAHNVNYLNANSLEELEDKTAQFYLEQEGKTILLEINTSSESNHVILADYFKYLSKSVNN